MTQVQERDFIFNTVKGIHEYATKTSFTTMSSEEVLPEVKAKLAFAEEMKKNFMSLHENINKRRGMEPEEINKEALLLNDFLTLCTQIKLKLLEAICIHEKQQPSTDSDMGGTTVQQLMDAMKNAFGTPRDNTRKRVNLPHVDIPQFAGKLTDWQQFSDMFTRMVHNNDSLEVVEKFHYLKTFLVGEAASTIKHLSVTEANYNIAWALVVKRYNKPKGIVSDYIKMFITISKKKVTNPIELKQLYMTYDEITQALDALNNTSRDSIMLEMAMEAIDQETNSLWAREPIQGQFATWREFLDFLDIRCDQWSSSWDKKQDNKTAKVNSAGAKTTGTKASTQGAHNASHGKSTVSSFVSTQTDVRKCAHCASAEHYIARCQQFLDAQPAQRAEIVRAAQLCFNCLRPGHRVPTCRSGPCKHCPQKHNSLLHESQTQVASVPQQVRDVSQANGNSSANSTLVNQSEVTTRSTIINLLPSVQLQVIGRGGVRHQGRALLDSCSQSNAITRRLAESLNIPLVSSQINTIKGIGAIPTCTPQAIRAEIKSKDNKVAMFLDFVVMDRITDEQPSRIVHMTQFPPSDWPLADTNFHKPGHIDMLLGADVFSRVVHGRRIEGNPTFYETAFGFIAMGAADVGNASTGAGSLITTCSCLMVGADELKQQMEKWWTLEEVQESQPCLSIEEQECEDHFVLNTTRNTEGRFEVRLPTKKNIHTLSTSLGTALRRFMCTERRLLKDQALYAHYKQFMAQYEELGHMREIPRTYVSSMPAVYLPHHPVVKESTTTPVRVVFDASAQTKSGQSLNQMLMVGPKVQDDIFDIMLRFRLHNIVLRADIQKMYRQIIVKPEDQTMQRILWRESPDLPIKTYLLGTVTYGTGCAPFIAVRCLKQLAIEEKSNYPLAAPAVENDFYVDDLLTGTTDIETAKQLQQQLHAMLQSGGFMLKKWISNSQEVMQQIPIEDQELSSSLDFDMEDTVKTLGMHWSPTTDDFKFSATIFNVIICKRNILSDMARIYDPLGLLAPITITAKILMQSLWKLNVGWDDQLDTRICTQWQKYQANVQRAVNLISIPRQITRFPSVVSAQLIAFCDASQRGFAACIYIRTMDSDGQVCCRLMTSKTKVAPLKLLSIPRLELCGASLLVKLLNKVRKAITIPIAEVHAFTDSMVTLHWIAGDPSRWKTFVANRVSRIQESVSFSQWHHVASKDNPADLASRGVQAEELTEDSIWWQGPTWLTDRDFNFVTPEIEHVDSSELEMRSTVLLVSTGEEFWEILYRFSSYTKLIRCVAYCRRFGHNMIAKIRGNSITRGQLSVTELRAAEVVILKRVQAECFPEEVQGLTEGNFVARQSKLLSLSPFIANDGLVRVGGRITHANVSYEQKHPVLLSHKHPITELIVRGLHVKLLHAGPQTLLANVRQQYWPTRGPSICSRVTRRCVTCFKVKPQLMQHYMADCHPSRVKKNMVFDEVGIDYCGPVYIRPPLRSKATLKMYVCLFTCLATRAIHIELVNDLTTGEFIAALERFIGDRGVPTKIRCDNASNFKGASNELKELANLVKSENYQSEVIAGALVHGIEFIFIPPRSPHFGGSWEAMIKRIKHHINRTIMNAYLNETEMRTMLKKIQACVNSRPLTPMSSDPNDLRVLTPGHFMILKSPTAIPQPDLRHIPEGRLQKWQVVEQRHQFFWQRWSSEYLHTLQQRRKWSTHHPHLEVNDLVLIKEDNIPPKKWALGRVMEVTRGTDGTPRVATLKTSTRITKRAVANLCRLPFDDKDSESEDSARPVMVAEFPAIQRIHETM